MSEKEILKLRKYLGIVDAWNNVAEPNCQHCNESEVECVEEWEIFFENTEKEKSINQRINNHG